MPKVRKGKTERKRANGATARNADNKAKRVAWQHGNGETNKTFPRETCNGKKNRYRVTGKGNMEVFV